MAIAHVVYESGNGTAWLAEGSSPSGFPWTPSSDGAKAGDLGVIAFARDRTAGGNTNMSAPTNWTGHTSQSPPKFLDIFYRRFLTAAEAAETVSPTLPGDSDHSRWKGIIRGVAPSGGASLQVPAIIVGNSLSYTAPTMPRAGMLLCICLDTWNGGNLSAAPTNGFTKRYYSTSIQWEANIGVWTKDVGSGAYSDGWPFSGAWGSQEHNAVIGIPDITLGESVTNARTQSWVVY